MVRKDPGGPVTLTPAEHAVLEALREARNPDGLPTGPGTKRFERRRLNPVDAAAAGTVEMISQVDHATCGRLVKAGLVRIDLAGHAHLAEPSEGMPPA